MRQTPHIFRKDLRHQWIDLTLYGVVLVAFGAITPDTWRGGDRPTSPLGLFWVLLRIIIPILWVVIVARLIHDESLVGDRQFWVTRPYCWTSLLAAKALFLGACVVAPFVAMQCSLVWQAGLHPLAVAGGLLESLAGMALIVWLPLLAFAVVTSNLQRMFLSLLVVVVAGAGVLAFLLDTGGPRMTPPFATEILSVLLGGLLVGIVVYQYAVRNTVRARQALLAVAGFFFVLIWFYAANHLPVVVNPLILHHYPAETNAGERLVFDPSPAGYRNPQLDAPAPGPLVTVKLPVQLEGMGPALRLQEVNAAVSIDAPGYHYVGPFRPAAIDDSGLPLILPPDVFQRVQAEEVRLHVTLIAERLLPGAAQMVRATDQFRAPGDGVCRLLTDQLDNNLVCRYASRRLTPTDVSGEVVDGPCRVAGPTHIATAVIHPMSAEPGLDPVMEEDPQMGGTVCFGTELTFVPYRSAGNFRLELDLPGLSLNRYTEYTRH